MNNVDAIDIMNIKKGFIMKLFLISLLIFSLTNYQIYCADKLVTRTKQQRRVLENHIKNYNKNIDNPEYFIKNIRSLKDREFLETMFKQSEGKKFPKIKIHKGGKYEINGSGKKIIFNDAFQTTKKFVVNGEVVDISHCKSLECVSDLISASFNKEKSFVDFSLIGSAHAQAWLWAIGAVVLISGVVLFSKSNKKKTTTSPPKPAPSVPDPDPAPAPDPTPDTVGLPAPVPTPEYTPTSEYKLEVHEGNNQLIVTSNMPPTWKVVFAVGSGAPGGGTAIQLFIPSTSKTSAVEGKPRKSCCAGLGLGNLEWRWRPWGKTNGTRGPLGETSKVTFYKVMEKYDDKVTFEMNGVFKGAKSFSRKTVITPRGFTTSVDAEYSGTTGQDSMWWLPMAINPSVINGDNITVKNANGSTDRMVFTTPRGPKMTKLIFPYEFTFGLFTPANHSIKMKVKKLAEGGGGSPNNYEYFHKEHNRGLHLFYPRWNGSFSHIKYSFQWEWEFVK